MKQKIKSVKPHGTKTYLTQKKKKKIKTSACVLAKTY